MLYSIVNDPLSTAFNLNHDLGIIQDWAYQWKMSFNLDPTKQANEVLFSRKKKPQDHPSLFFNGSPVTTVENQKHLGLTLDKTLSFRPHIEEKIIKVNKLIGILKHISTFMPHKSLNQIYKSFVRPHFDYCDVIYHIPHSYSNHGIILNDLMEKIEKCQYKAALAITGTWKGSNRSKLYEEIGWESLTDRRSCRRSLLLHKIINNNTPAYLKTLLPEIRQPFLPNVFRNIQCRSSKYKNSFFPDAIHTWNHIICNFDDLPSITVLKKHLLSLFRPKCKSIFGIVNPTYLPILYQLRVGLSNLRSHKVKHNFCDTPTSTCLCGAAIESTDHFFNSCSLYNEQRLQLMSKVNVVLRRNNLVIDSRTKLLLYGHPQLNDTDNKLILTYSLEYLNSSKRFTE